MEASAALAEGVDRTLVTAYVWDNVVDHFIEGNHRKAKFSFRLVAVLEDMTDDEYNSACVCTNPECSCHL